MAPSTITVRADQDEPLDAVIWRATGETVGVIEAVLQAESGLALAGDRLAQGRLITIPAGAAAQQASPMLQLWD